QCAQAVHHRVEQGAEHVRPRDFELAPQLALGTPLLLPDWRQGQKNRPVAQIRPANHLLNPVQEDGPRRFKQHLLVVGAELPDGEGAAAGEPHSASESQIGKPDRLSNASRWPLLAAIISSRSSRESERTGPALGSIRALSSLERTVLAEPCSPDTAKSG